MSIINDFYPITRTVGAIHGKIEDVAKAAVSELNRTIGKQVEGSVGSSARRSISSDVETQSPVEFHLREIYLENLKDAFDYLIPLTLGTKILLLQTSNPNWTVYFDNSSKCTGYNSLMASLSVFLKTRTIYAFVQPNTVRKLPSGKIIGAWGGVQVYVYNGRIEAERIISVVNDAGSWHFDTLGEPYNFENVDKYTIRKKADRFTYQDLLLFFHGFGLRPFDDDFYKVGPREPVLSIERVDHVEEVKKRFSAQYDMKKIRARFEGNIS